MPGLDVLECKTDANDENYVQRISRDLLCSNTTALYCRDCRKDHETSMRPASLSLGRNSKPAIEANSVTFRTGMKETTKAKNTLILSRKRAFLKYL
jgi:hypothetical protein